jgi:hypothetical protein
MKRLMPLTAQQIKTLWRSKYPEALVCTQCGRLISTKNNITEYTCAECRWDQGASARLTKAFRTLKPRVQLRPPCIVLAEGDGPYAAESRELLAKADMVAAGYDYTQPEVKAIRRARSLPKVSRASALPEIPPSAMGYSDTDVEKDGQEDRINTGDSDRLILRPAVHKGGRPRVHKNRKAAVAAAARAYRKRQQVKKAPTEATLALVA